MIAWEPSRSEVDQYIQELDRKQFQRRYEQAVFDKQPEPVVLTDLLLIAAIGAIGWLIWYGVARAI